MNTFVLKKRHFREGLVFSLTKKTDAKSHRLLLKAYGEHALSEPSCR